LPIFDKSSMIFQQDNARCHVSNSTQKWLANKKIDTLDWPALSCDLNIIENVWGIMTKRLYAKNHYFDNLASLKGAVMREAEKISEETIKSLYKSFFGRCMKVFKKDGKF